MKEVKGGDVSVMNETAREPLRKENSGRDGECASFCTTKEMSVWLAEKASTTVTLNWMSKECVLLESVTGKVNTPDSSATPSREEGEEGWSQDGTAPKEALQKPSTAQKSVAMGW